MGIYPCLTYRDIPAAIDWLSNAFGVDGRVLSAGGPGEGVDHAILTFRDAAILVESERPGPGGSSAVRIPVAPQGKLSGEGGGSAA